MAAKFEIYEDKASKWRWRLKAGNGEIVASGESYETKAGAKKGVQAVKRATRVALVRRTVSADARETASGSG